MLKISNTLTGQKEPFEPQKPGEVKMYVCGPTVYGFTHVGNARPAVFFDVVRRYLEHIGFRVNYVSNYTDVDDKIINRAREEKRTASEVAATYIEEYVKDLASLSVRSPDHCPKVTDHIPEIISFIQTLVDKKSAYATADGEVFFSVRNFPGYGKLSKKNIDELQVGARVQPGEAKKDPLDFSLWKPQKAEDEPAWESPWGKGRPGWHIECSVMSIHILGTTFDIHGGGMDLIHPHHENEIAQSEAFSGQTFARYWLHNNLLKIENEKMSKSLGNIFLTRDFVRSHTAETLKFMLLSGHYRSTIDFSQQHIRESQSALHRFYTTAKKTQTFIQTDKPAVLPPTAEEKDLLELGKIFENLFRDSMDDDFNTAKLIGHIFEYVRRLNGYVDRKGFKPNSSTVEISRKFMELKLTLSRILNLFGEDPAQYLQSLRSSVIAERGIKPEYIADKIEMRTQARKAKDFATADAIRNDLMKQGILIMDTAQGTEWDISFTEKN